MKVRFVPTMLLLAAFIISTFTNLVVPQPAIAASAPNLSISNSSIVEGDTGVSQAVVDVTLSKPSISPVTVTYSTKDIYGTVYDIDNHGAAFGVTAASTSGDYIIQQNQQLVFAPGEVQKSVRISILPNERIQPNRLFSVDINSAVGANIVDGSGTVTIIDDDTQPNYFRLGIGDVSMREAAAYYRTANVVVNFSDPAPRPFNLTVSTIDATAVGVPNASTLGGNFVTKNVTIPVAAGTKSKVIPVILMPNTIVDGTKYFSVKLSTDFGVISRQTGRVYLRDAQASYSRAGRRPGPPRIALVGDSVTANYQEVAKQQFERRGYQVYKYGYPGKGLLDADWCHGELADKVVTESDPDVVVFESMANYGPFFTPCVHKYTYNGLIYNTELKSVVKLYDTKFTSNGAQLYWVQAPGVPSDNVDSAARMTSILYLNSLYPALTLANPKSHIIDAFTPFGGNTPDCSLRDAGLLNAGVCLHLNVRGEALLSNVINAGVK